MLNRQPAILDFFSTLLGATGQPPTAAYAYRSSRHGSP